MFLRVFIAFFWTLGVFADPYGVFLSWRGDPTSTMAVQWFEKGGKSQLLYYGEASQEVPGKVPAASKKLGDKLPSIYRGELTGLKSDTEYVFWIEEKGKAVSPVMRFRTLPKTLDKPLRFVVGGDGYDIEELFRRMNKVVAKEGPAFVVFGGDIAYAYGLKKKVFKGSNADWQRWETFFKIWSEQMVDPEGRMIPLVAVVGNHDVKSGGRPLFYDLFLFDEDMVSYRTLDLGDYCSLFLLDTGHTQKITGKQQEWLKGALEKRQNIPYKFAVYHVPAYPVLGNYAKSTPTKIRATWVPLFEQGGIQVVFEHHGHLYKRSVPIRNNQEDPSGIVYLGDGGWGVTPRKPVNPQNLWYVAKVGRINAVFLVDMAADQCTIRAMDNQGRFFDEPITIFPEHASSAR